MDISLDVLRVASIDTPNCSRASSPIDDESYLYPPSMLEDCLRNCVSYHGYSEILGEWLVLEDLEHDHALKGLVCTLGLNVLHYAILFCCINNHILRFIQTVLNPHFNYITNLNLSPRSMTTTWD